jgi:protein gp37
MAANSKIEWCHHTFNPWRGCTKVSAGCANCYAETLSHRNPKVLGVWGDGGTRVVASESAWREPRKWNDWRHEHDCGREATTIDAAWYCPEHGECAADEIHKVPFDAATHQRHRVFCASLADVFEDRPELHTPRARLFQLIAETPNLDWLLLTSQVHKIGNSVSPPVARAIVEANFAGVLV